MKTRRFGRTGHMSTVAIFGAFAFSTVTQAEADAGMEMLISAGVNHIDVAPTYGEAEARLGPWMARERQRFFLGCKTMERSQAGAMAELHRSLNRLQVDRFDLYQIHAIETMEDLDKATAPGGALDALIAAREAGLTRYLGITGHGADIPAVFLEALRRFDFDSILFPINFIQYADSTYRQTAEQLLQKCRARDVGTMIIKSIARGPWEAGQKDRNTWYRPFTDPALIQQGVNFALSQDVTGICTAGDIHLLPMILEACENYSRLTSAEQEALIASAIQYEPLFPQG